MDAFQYKLYESRIEQLYQKQRNVYPFYSSIQNNLSKCLHGNDCPMCRAEKEADEISKNIKEKEYKERCDKYIKEFRENKK